MLDGPDHGVGPAYLRRRPGSWTGPPGRRRRLRAAAAPCCPRRPLRAVAREPGHRAGGAWPMGLTGWCACRWVGNRPSRAPRRGPWWAPASRCQRRGGRGRCGRAVLEVVEARPGVAGGGRGLARWAIAASASPPPVRPGPRTAERHAPGVSRGGGTGPWLARPGRSPGRPPARRRWPPRVRPSRRRRRVSTCSQVLRPGRRTAAAARRVVAPGPGRAGRGAVGGWPSEPAQPRALPAMTASGLRAGHRPARRCAGPPPPLRSRGAGAVGRGARRGAAGVAERCRSRAGQRSRADVCSPVPADRPEAAGVAWPSRRPDPGTRRRRGVGGARRPAPAGFGGGPWPRARWWWRRRWPTTAVRPAPRGLGRAEPAGRRRRAACRAPGTCRSRAPGPEAGGGRPLAGVAAPRAADLRRLPLAPFRAEQSVGPLAVCPARPRPHRLGVAPPTAPGDRTPTGGAGDPARGSAQAGLAGRGPSPSSRPTMPPRPSRAPRRRASRRFARWPFIGRRRVVGAGVHRRSEEVVGPAVRRWPKRLSAPAFAGGRRGRRSGCSLVRRRGSASSSGGPEGRRSGCSLVPKRSGAGCSSASKRSSATAFIGEPKTSSVGPLVGGPKRSRVLVGRAGGHRPGRGRRSGALVGGPKGLSVPAFIGGPKRSSRGWPLPGPGSRTPGLAAHGPAGRWRAGDR